VSRRRVLGFSIAPLPISACAAGKAAEAATAAKTSASTWRSSRKSKDADARVRAALTTVGTALA